MVQRLDEDLGIADLGERPAGVAKVDILFAVFLLVDHRPDQPEHRADLLERLSRLVDGLVPRPFVWPGATLQGLVHLSPHDPPDVLAERLVGIQLNGHGMASRAPGDDPAGVWPTADSFLVHASRTPGAVASRATDPDSLLQELPGAVGSMPC